jgi:hypothetical protein
MSETATQVLTWVRLNWFFVLFMTVVIGAFLFLRTQASDIEDSDALTTILYDGQPAVIEFYSNY